MKAQIRILLAVLVLFGLLVPFNLAANGQEEGAKTGTINFWHGYPEMDVVWKEKAAKDFMVENPGLKVEVSSFPLRDFEKKLAVSMPAGTGPDVYYFGKNFNLRFIKAGLVAKPTADVEAFVDASFPSIYKDNASFDGQLWGMPFGGGINLAFWNKDMYAEAGLDHAPQSWDEVIDFAKKTTKYDASGNVTRSGVSLRLSGGGSGIAEKWWIWMMPQGGTIAEEGAEAGKYHAAYDNEAGRKTLKLYIDLLHKYKVDSPNIKHDAEAFALEQTAYFQRESWVIGYLKEHAPDLNYDTATLPKGVRRAGPAMGQEFYVYEKSDMQDAAWDFAQYLEKPEYLKAIINDVGWLTCRNDVSYEEIFKKEPRLRVAMEMPEGYVGMVYPAVTTSDEIYTKLAERLVPAFQDASLVDNPAAIAKIISNAAKETNDILKESGEYSK